MGGGGGLWVKYPFHLTRRCEWLLTLILGNHIFIWCHSSYPALNSPLLAVNSLYGHCYIALSKIKISGNFLCFKAGNPVSISSPLDSFSHPSGKIPRAMENKIGVILSALPEQRITVGRKGWICSPAWIWQDLFGNLIKKCYINISMLSRIRVQGWS